MNWLNKYRQRARERMQKVMRGIILRRAVKMIESDAPEDCKDLARGLYRLLDNIPPEDLTVEQARAIRRLWK